VYKENKKRFNAKARRRKERFSSVSSVVSLFLAWGEITTLQNRVTPFGEIVAVPERGTFTGNRGILHDDQRRLTSRRWTTHAWIVCLLEFKDRHREVMTPGTWTELFFLDEATALAAGHRPCGECRRADYARFKACWIAGNHAATIQQIDRQLHAERVAPRTHAKVTYEAEINNLPDSVMIALNGDAYLIWRGDLLKWSPGGYHERIAQPNAGTVTVLTPRSTVNAIRAGYVPQVHESAWT
jgi:hypothetical protein